MAITENQNPKVSEITCGSLLLQLQKIWNEVGESDEERDNMLLQLEQDCLDVYKRKVDQASKSRALLLQDLADSRVKLTTVLSALGEKTSDSVPEVSSGTIKEQLAAIAPALECLFKKKQERIKEFFDVQSQIQTICHEIAGKLETGGQVKSPVVDECDLSLKKLDEFQYQLQKLQKEKNDRLLKVSDFVSTVHDLCSVLGNDFFSTITEVHPSLHESTGLQYKNISNETLAKLAKTVLFLEEDKKLRLQKLQELASQLTDLWNLMDTPMEERSFFDHVTCNIALSVEEVASHGALALDLIEQVEVEVQRLDQLKSSKMKEIALKKQAELEDIYNHVHIEIDSAAAQEKIFTIIDSGNVEPSELFADMDNQILKAKEEAISRKEILEKVEKWMSVCEEESWLEDYSRDENRYNSSRGAHLNLKRAEKARVLVNKIPALVDTLVTRTRAWEEDRGLQFIYDGVPLLAMLDEYVVLRQEREEEKRKTRDQKKSTEQPPIEQDPLVFGPRPSPSRPAGPKKAVLRTNGSAPNGSANRRLSMTSHQSSGNGARSASRDGTRDSSRSASPGNPVSVAKENAAAQHVSG